MWVVVFFTIYSYDYIMKSYHSSEPSQNIPFAFDSALIIIISTIHYLFHYICFLYLCYDFDLIWLDYNRTLIDWLHTIYFPRLLNRWHFLFKLRSVPFSLSKHKMKSYFVYYKWIFVLIKYKLLLYDRMLMLNILL